MSYDMWVWKGPAYTLRTINYGIARIEAGDEAAFDPSPALRSFRNAVLEAVPLSSTPIAERPASRPAGDTWASTPNISDRLIELNLTFGVRDEQLDAVLRLVDEHDLWLYDPQRALVQEPRSRRGPQPSRWRRWLRRVG